MTAELKKFLGIELGSTRIKAVIIDEVGEVIRTSDTAWKSVNENGYWTYDLADVDKGVNAVISNLNYNLSEISAVGVSAMMHGYLAFDKDDNLLTPFRTWQNTTTSRAAEELSEVFNFNIPQRWSIAHLYQAILDNEAHISNIAYITTLAGYVHYKLTGEKVLGIGDASGMFPVDPKTCQYNSAFVEKFDRLLNSHSVKFSVEDVLPKILLAGDNAGTFKNNGYLTTPFSASTIFAPPEGDAGTGMVATNAIKPKTGNVSAGTSVFAMVVLENAMKSYYEEVDVVTTPLGNEVAMVHANNCTLDINAWISLFAEVLACYGVDVNMDKLFDIAFTSALKGSKNGGGLLNYPYVTGEQITNVETGIPAFLRLPGSEFTLANFMRTHLMSCLSALKIGFNILKSKENVEIHQLLGHGGFFKSGDAGLTIMSAAINCEVATLQTANEGGAWGMALLAAFTDHHENTSDENKQSLSDYLDFTIFKDAPVRALKASTADVDGFNEYIQNFESKLFIERGEND